MQSYSLINQYRNCQNTIWIENIYLLFTCLKSTQLEPLSLHPPGLPLLVAFLRAGQVISLGSLLGSILFSSRSTFKLSFIHPILNPIPPVYFAVDTNNAFPLVGLDFYVLCLQSKIHNYMLVELFTANFCLLGYFFLSYKTSQEHWGDNW